MACQKNGIKSYLLSTHLREGYCGLSKLLPRQFTGLPTKVDRLVGRWWIWNNTRLWEGIHPKTAPLSNRSSKSKVASRSIKKKKPRTAGQWSVNCGP